MKLRSVWRVVRAYGFAARAHRGQVDKQGQPYIRHLRRVAWMAYGLTGDPEAAVVGLLHDYIEDVNWAKGREEVERLFGALPAARVQALSREPNRAYTDYVRVLLRCSDRVVFAVKIADLLHNLDGTRRKQRGMWVEEGAVYRHSLYLSALAMLAKGWAGPQSRDLLKEPLNDFFPMVTAQAEFVERYCDAFHIPKESRLEDGYQVADGSVRFRAVPCEGNCGSEFCCGWKME